MGAICVCGPAAGPTGMLALPDITAKPGLSASISKIESKRAAGISKMEDLALYSPAARLRMPLSELGFITFAIIYIPIEQICRFPGRRRCLAYLGARPSEPGRLHARRLVRS